MITKTQQIEGLNAEIARISKLLAAGGFSDAEGNWIALGTKAIESKKAAISRIRDLIAKVESQQ